MGRHVFEELADELGDDIQESDELARQVLERKLSTLNRQPVYLSITDNRHSMIHATRKSGVLSLRLHHMFLDAPVPVVRALSRFLVDRERDASRAVGHYIDSNTARIRTNHAKSHSLNHDGEHHQLLDMFQQLNSNYFDECVACSVTWGHLRKHKKKQQSSIKLGSYSVRERLIRVHPRLDQAFVPEYFVSFVLYHEMLHHVIPPSGERGKRIFHPPEFREREKNFLHYERACQWQRENLDRLLCVTD